MNLSHKKLAFIIFGVAVLVFLLFYFGLSQYITPGNLKENASYLKGLVREHYITAAIGFMVISALLMLLTLPLTGPIAVCGGFLFGLWVGVLYTMIGVITGIAISFLIVRYTLFHAMHAKYNDRLASFNARMQEYGYTYLISLQLLTVVPYFIINTLAALAGIPFITFLWTTIVGAFPIVVIYAFAGKELYMIRAWSDILSMNMVLMLLALAAVALIPIIIQKFRRKRSE